MDTNINWIGRTVAFFVRSKVTPLFLAFAMFLGIIAVVNLPREEEPQISVPMFDIFVRYPGATAQEVEQRIINVGERKLWEISGVEYIYSTANADGGLIVVRFKVGEDVEKSLTKLYTKVFANLDLLPPGASQPLIKTHSIDDVPILSLTFHSDERDTQSLRKIVAGVRQSINAIPDISETHLIGGRKRQFSVYPDPQKLTAHLLDAQTVMAQIAATNVKTQNGHLETAPTAASVQTDSFFRTREDLANLVVSLSGGNIVYLKDIAAIVDGPDDEERAVNIRFGAGSSNSDGAVHEAVTLAVSKRKGANATRLCEEVLAKIEGMRGGFLPSDVQMTVTRDYGETAAEKSNELLSHMGIAVMGVAVLIALFLGIKEAGVVAVAIPVTLALTMASFYWMGFTLNRITLFALIFSIGILVDDPIVNVENIVRHLRLPQNKGRKFLDIVIEAVNEVQSPLILATLTVVAAILPMAFVGGLMGPYMRPIPIGSSMAMLFSMMSAFVATPWAAYMILRKSHEKIADHGDSPAHAEDFLTKAYRWYMNPLIYNPKVRKNFLIVMAVLLVLSIALVPLKGVKVKMLPFDNKDEFQVILDMPEGTSLKTTTEAIEAVARYLQTVPEVDNIETYIGTSAPYNFNGLVRHYYLRSRPHEADLQVNLLGKDKRRRQSHAIAKSVRPKIHEIVARYGGDVQVAEVPPGPPVLSTLSMEIYGHDNAQRDALALQVRAAMEANPNVTDLTTHIAADEKLLSLAVDRERAQLNGIAPQTIAQTAAAALAGTTVDLAHLSEEYEPVGIVLRLPADRRASLDAVLGMTLLSRTGVAVPLRDLVRVNEGLVDKPIYHKNLMRVSYVLGDVSGPFESPVYVLFDLDRELKKLPVPAGSPQKSLPMHWTDMPRQDHEWAVKFDGEWQITFEVFRDLGIAFAIVLVLIYALVVGWFQSFKTPVIIMLPIPLTLIGILPAHWIFGVFFSATSMIGMIAGAGIVVRNSIILVDFIQLRLREGMSLEEAVIDAGATRFRPMLLTAMAVVVGASVILFDPIFQGLAVALMAGEVASTFLSRTAIPVIYYMANQPKAKKESVC